MKTLDNITVYKCDFCKKKLFRKHAMEHHEKYCVYRQDNIPACSGCVFLKETTNEVCIGRGDYGEKVDIPLKAFECTKLNKMLYPLKVVRNGRLKKSPEWFTDQELMPNKCEHQKLVTEE